MIVTYKDLKTRVYGYIVRKYTDVKGMTQRYIYRLIDPDTKQPACQWSFDSSERAKEWAKENLPRK